MIPFLCSKQEREEASWLVNMVHVHTLFHEDLDDLAVPILNGNELGVFHRVTRECGAIQCNLVRQVLTQGEVGSSYSQAITGVRFTTWGLASASTYARRHDQMPAVWGWCDSKHVRNLVVLQNVTNIVLN